MNKSHAGILRKAQELLHDADTGEWDDIADALESMHLDDPADLAVRGRCRLQAHRFDGALADLEAAVSGGVKDPEVYFDLGTALMTMANLEKLAAAGHNYHEHAAKGDPHDTAERAIECLRNAVLLLPDSDEAAYALCDELERLGQYDEALSVLYTYKKFDIGRNRLIYYHIGKIYGRQGNWKKAYASYVESLCPPVPSPKDNNYAFKKHQYDQFTRIHKLVADLDPEDFRSFALLGVELYKAEWMEEATTVISTAALMHPRLELYMAIGDFYTAEIYLNEAIDNYIEGIRALSGKCPPADLAPLYEALVMNLADCGRASEAEKYAQEAISLGAEGPKLRKHWALAMDPTDDFSPLRSGWISPSYLGARLLIEVDGKIVPV